MSVIVANIQRLKKAWLFSAAIALLAPSDNALANDRSADLVLLNGNILTMAPDDARATALAVDDGVIIGVGTDAEMSLLAGPDTKILNAQGRFVAPGFIDTHLHPQPLYEEMGPYGRLDMSPDGGVGSREAMFAKLREKAAAMPRGRLILGQSYDENVVGGHPTAKELDAVVPNHPVILMHSSGHRRAVNTMALQAAGITDETPDPKGGSIQRDAQGHATGIILEIVPGFAPLYDALPQPDDAQRLAAYRKQFRAFMSQGVTGLGVASATPRQVADYRSLLQSGLPMHINAMVLYNYLDWVIENRAKEEWQIPGLTMRSIKVFHGNSLSGHTAWLYEPYASDPSYYGMPPKRSQADLNAMVAKVHNAGLQSAIHSNGDREIDMVLTAIEAAQAANPRPDPRHRIEHASIVNPRILNRIKTAGVGLAPHSYVLNHGQKMEAHGAARWDMMHPNRSALDLAIPVGGSSDSPVSPANVMERIQSMVTRRARSNGKVYGAAQRVTAEQALGIWTRGSAYLQFEEGEYGSLEIGKRADFVILSADPTTTDPEKISSIFVEDTFIGGNISFQRNGDRGDFHSW